MAAGFITLVRRTFVALVVGMALAAAIRVRGRGGVPPQTGGWRELQDDELAGRSHPPIRSASGGRDL